MLRPESGCQDNFPSKDLSEGHVSVRLIVLIRSISGTRENYYSPVPSHLVSVTIYKHGWYKQNNQQIHLALYSPLLGPSTSLTNAKPTLKWPAVDSRLINAGAGILGPSNG